LEKSNVPPFITQGENVFSFYLSKSQEKEGNFVVGGWDLDQFAKKGLTDDDIPWVNLADEGSWTIPINNFKFENSD
jgi:hypothetical protein